MLFQTRAAQEQLLSGFVLFLQSPHRRVTVYGHNDQVAHASSRMPIIKCAAGALDLLEDIGGFGGPDEGFGILAMFVDVLTDGHDEFFGVMKDAAP